MDEQVYQLWYEYLKRSVRYKECCSNGGIGDLGHLKDLEDVYSHFGDVHALSWEEWWPTHQFLFSDIEPMFVINEIETKADFDYMFDDYADDLLGLVVNVYAPKEVILAEIDKVLKRRISESLEKEHEESLKTNSKAKKKKRHSNLALDLYHLYGLNPIPSSKEIAVLKRRLKIYDAHKNDPSITLAELGGAEKLDNSILEQMSHEEKNDYAANNIVIANSIARDVYFAKIIIGNTERGLFPNIAKPESDVCDEAVSASEVQDL